MGKIGLYLSENAAKQGKMAILPFSAAFAAAQCIDFQ
jgi:hypothetical protein